MEKIDNNIVAGAGIWGCTLARRLAEAGRKVLVLEKRAQIGGNCACEIDPETGVEIHSYGSHIFHTKDEKVWEFVNRFAKFNDYRHCVLANHAGKIYHLPFGRTLYDEFLGKGSYELPLNDAQNTAIFDAFIKNYTAKQWGMSADKVDPAVIKRLKVRDSYSTDYFDDPYQGIPVEGYNKLFERLLDHENISIECNVDFNLDLAAKLALRGARIFYSGPLDRLFNYKYGALPWRSLRFETEKLPVADYQHNSVVNYPDAEVPYTRIHEFRHYHPEWKAEKRGGDGQRTIIMREYSKTWESGDEPYYPISNPESTALLAKYQEEVKKFNHHSPPPPFRTTSLIVGGRLGGYRYYDMDQAMAAALEMDL